MQHAIRHRLASLLLASSLFLTTGTVTGVPAAAAPADATQHTLVLTPQVVHTGVEEYRSDNPLLDGDEPPCSADAGQVGYTHSIFITLRDSYDNCVWQTAVRFDLSELSQYPEAIITRATLTYTDSLNTLQLPDGHRAADPYDLNNDAIWGSCVARLTVPTADWRNDIGLTPNVDDDTIERLDGSTWVITNQVNHWYFEPDYKNYGLLFLGYDEGDQFSNSASCLTTLSDFKLQVDFVSSDTPSPTPTPNLAQRSDATGNAGSVALPTSTPGLAARSNATGNAAIVPTLTPTPLPVDPSGIRPIRPDLTIGGVDTVGQKDARGLTPLCSAGQSTTFMVHVKNAGTAATTDTAVVSLSIDGVPRATTTVDPIAPGSETIATIEGLVLSSGNHTYSVTVNDGRKIQESSFSNNSFARDNLVCV